MRSWTRSLVTALLAAVLLGSVGLPPAAASEGGMAAPGFDMAAPGFVIVQIDGLSLPMLQTALDDDAMPFIASLLESGSHTLGGWHTTAATATPVLQAGLLHGRWRHIPGFRWWDREEATLFDILDRDAAHRFEERIDGPRDLLADDGASITNLFTGGAPRVVFTATHLEGMRLPWEVVRYVADARKAVFVVLGFLDGARSAVRRVSGRDAAPLVSGIKRKAPVPLVGPALEWALVDATTAAVVREIERGTKLSYATYTTYDEVGHYAGTDHAAAVDALGHIDRAVALLAAAAADGPRPYHLVILSDHGQSPGRSFELRYGETLTEVLGRLLEADDGDGAGDVSDGESAYPVVAASGNLAHIYLDPLGPRLDLAGVEARFPGLVEGLVQHPGVGIVAALTDGGGAVAIGPAGWHDLASGHVDGLDPLGDYGHLAAESMRNIIAPATAGDLVVISSHDPATGEVASFEPQLGSHGGIGGPQMEPFLLYPTELESGEAPLSLEGVDELRSAFERWLDLPSSAQLGKEVCVSADVPGATGEVCAHRDGFGADWSLRLSDTADDGHPVRATLSLDVVDAPDEEATVDLDGGADTATATNGVFRPRLGSGLGDVGITTCVVRRFLPDRCRTATVALPQLEARANDAQLTRLRQLVFEMPLEEFMAEWARDDHAGVDADFDWSTDGCSAGRLAGLFDESQHAACVRHDFGYRNLGQQAFDPRDEVRRRVDEQLAADLTASGEGILASSLFEALQLFAAPVFHGQEPTAAWDVPDIVAPLLQTPELTPAPD